MLSRREAALLLVGTAFPGPAFAQNGNGASVFYASSGPDLVLYGLDAGAAVLRKTGSVTLPANIQYAWPHPSKTFLYVASSNVNVSGSIRVARGTDHAVTTFAVDPASGRLKPLGPAQKLAGRPINLSVDRDGHYAFMAYNDPSNISVHRIDGKGLLGPAIAQRQKLDTGIFAHQVRAVPSKSTVILVTRGNDASAGKPEDPGAIKVFGFHDGQLSNLQSVAPANGFGFGPRHLDFHPSLPFVYVSMERERQLYVFEVEADGTLKAQPTFKKDLLKDQKGQKPGQVSGPIHVSADGRFVYVANRNSNTADQGGKAVWTGGENNMAVFAIDARTGEPNLIQHAEVPAVDVRTFTIDPSGRLLIATSTEPMLVRKGSGLAMEGAGFSLYRIARDGRLAFVRKVDADAKAGNLLWCGTLNMA